MAPDSNSKLYCAVALSCIVLWVLVGTLDSFTAIVAMAVAICVVGLPHGALDFAIARLIGLCSSPVRIILFLVAYLGVVVISIVFWLWLPAAGLVIFLWISVHHFASDWQSFGFYWHRLAISTMIVCASSILYASTLTDIFTLLLLSKAQAQWLILAMQVCSLLSAAFFLVTVFSQRSLFNVLSLWQRVELIFLLMSSVLVSPLLHFTLYFCLLHSIKHFSRTAQALNASLARATFLAIPFVAITMLGALIIAWIRPSELPSIALIQYIFIGLFGLTIAHMLLTEHWRRLS